MPGKGVGGVLTLQPTRKVGRIARTQVETARSLPESAQVGADGRDVFNALLFHGRCQQSAAVRLQFQPDAGAAVAPVVPFQRHDAAAGTQVGGFLGAFRLAEAGQQQRIRPEPVRRRTVYTGSIIQDFGGMFHRQCDDSSQKNSGNCFPNLCKNKKQQTRFCTGLLLLMRYSGNRLIIQQ